MGTLFAVLHVAAAVFIAGPMAILPHTGLRSLRTGNGPQVASLARSVNIFTLLSLLVFVLGFAAMGTAPKSYDISFSDTWIWLSIVLYAVAFLLSVLLIVPRMRSAAAQLESGTAEGKPAGYGAIAGSAGVVTILLVAVVVLMAWRP